MLSVVASARNVKIIENNIYNSKIIYLQLKLLILNETTRVWFKTAILQDHMHTVSTVLFLLYSFLICSQNKTKKIL